jgi:hypothetical protein
VRGAGARPFLLIEQARFTQSFDRAREPA